MRTKPAPKNVKRILRVYNLADYSEFKEMCREQNSSATREINNFISRTAASAREAHDGKLRK